MPKCPKERIEMTLRLNGVQTEPIVGYLRQIEMLQKHPNLSTTGKI